LKLDKLNAVAALAALAQEQRLEIYRLLVQAEPDGSQPAKSRARSGLPPNRILSLSNRLRHAGLVTSSARPIAHLRSALRTMTICSANSPTIAAAAGRSCASRKPRRAKRMKEACNVQEKVWKRTREAGGTGKDGQAAKRVSSPSLLLQCIAAVRCSPITSTLRRQREDALPEAAVLASLGCGNPTALAQLSAGETVLDLGSGRDRRSAVGATRRATGKVYGLDMTTRCWRLRGRTNERRASGTSSSSKG